MLVRYISGIILQMFRQLCIFYLNEFLELNFFELFELSSIIYHFFVISPCVYLRKIDPNVMVFKYIVGRLYIWLGHCHLKELFI